VVSFDESLADHVRSIERTNIVQSRKFREALEQAMLRYTNKQITTAEMIAKLLELARWVRVAQKHGQNLGLNEEETAFYDALAENGSAKDVMKSDTLRLTARELTEMVKQMRKLHWTQRESVRADLRRNVRRLLAKFGYPPRPLRRRHTPRITTSRTLHRKHPRLITIATNKRPPPVNSPTPAPRQ
jgi:type I restriction enzyme R subunit